MRIIIHGDIHGSTGGLAVLCDYLKLTQQDILVLLGDVGANYYLNEYDDRVKEQLNALGPTLLCIHGNHEARPWHIADMETRLWQGGTVWFQPQYPRILYAKDGEIYQLGNHRCMAIGGAYSVDKYRRLARNWQWFEDEQPSPEIKAYVEAQLAAYPVDVVFSHTCPAKHTPFECFLPGIRQADVDSSTEDWLDKIEDTLTYKAWYCGHWHTNKRAKKLHFLFDDYEILPEAMSST